MDNLQRRELLTLLLWLISPDIAGQKPDIDSVISIITRSEERLKVAVDNKFYDVKVLRDNEGNATKLNISRQLWSRSLYLDIIGAPKISF